MVFCVLVCLWMCHGGESWQNVTKWRRWPRRAWRLNDWMCARMLALKMVAVPTQLHICAHGWLDSMMWHGSKHGCVCLDPMMWHGARHGCLDVWVEKPIWERLLKRWKILHVAWRLCWSCKVGPCMHCRIVYGVLSVANLQGFWIYRVLALTAIN